MENKKKWEDTLDRWDKGTHIISSIITVIGICLICWQMYAINKQNKIAEHNMLQSYRPLAKFSIENEYEFKNDITGDGKIPVIVN